MLMSQKLGTRLADDCVSPEQAQAAAGPASRETADLLDGLTDRGAADGSGIKLKVTGTGPAKAR